jgi:hypothetical protein
MEKETTTKYVLCANALLLVLGTIVKNMNSPIQSAAMSAIFIAWLAITGWYVYRSTEASSTE